MEEGILNAVLLLLSLVLDISDGGSHFSYCPSHWIHSSSVQNDTLYPLKKNYTYFTMHIYIECDKYIRTSPSTKQIMSSTYSILSPTQVQSNLGILTYNIRRFS